MFDEILHSLRKTRLGSLDHGGVEQAGSAAALFAGYFDGITTVGEEFGGSHLGLGVMDNLAGEIVSIDGKTWAIPSSGVPRLTSYKEKIAFGVSAHGGMRHRLKIPAGVDTEGLTEAVDRALDELHADHEEIVAALRIQGTFTNVTLRTVHQPDFPGESLGEVIDDEIRFVFDRWEGTIIGFRYPDHSSGSTIPGLHLHGIDKHLQSGGHVRNATIAEVRAELWLDHLHIHDQSNHSDSTPIDFTRYEGKVPG